MAAMLADYEDEVRHTERMRTLAQSGRRNCTPAPQFGDRLQHGPRTARRGVSLAANRARACKSPSGSCG